MAQKLHSINLNKDSPMERLWSKDTIALVTGANKGIGLQIVRELAKQGVTTVLTSRNEEHGKTAIEKLHKEGLQAVYHQLDITSPDSVEELAKWLSQTYGKIDILINNSGITANEFNVDEAKLVINTNYFGTKRMIEAITPIMKPAGRVVNISSKASDLNFLKNEWKSKLENISNLRPETVDEFVRKYIQAVETGNVVAEGWPCPAEGTSLPTEYMSEYAASKIALNAYTRCIAEELMKRGKIYINCMGPGVTATRMTNYVGHSTEVGADTAVWLALLKSSEDAPTGRFFMNRIDVGFAGQKVFYNGQFHADGSDVLDSLVKDFNKQKERV